MTRPPRPHASPLRCASASSGIARQACQSSSVACISETTCACCICPGEVATPILKNRPEPVPQEDIERLLQPEDLAAMAVFAATMPAHVNITEMLVVPTYMRLIAPNARKIAAMP